MDLSCNEDMSSQIVAGIDLTIIRDDRVIENLLNDEKAYIPTVNYFEEVQTDVQPFMRKVVTTWMLEVCLLLFS